MKNTEHPFTESLYCWCYEAQLSDKGRVCIAGMLGERSVQEQMFIAAYEGGKLEELGNNFLQQECAGCPVHSPETL